MIAVIATIGALIGILMVSFSVAFLTHKLLIRRMKEKSTE